VDAQWKKRDALFDKTVDRSKKQSTPSTRKYVDFYRQWLPRLSPIFGAQPTASREDETRIAPDGMRYTKREFVDFFGGLDEWRAAAARRRFADVGAAPGGMSETLVKVYGWHGHAFSLAVREEGFGMSFRHPWLTYDDANLAEDSSWRDMLRVAPPASCDFINLGIVVDRGQQKDDAMRSKIDAARSKCEAEGKSAPSCDGEDGDGAGVLSFLAILANELRFGLQALAPGGCLYFAYQTGGNLPLLYRILLVLRPAFARMRLTPTFAAHRTPVYIFLGEYAGLESEAGAAALAFFHETPTTGATALNAWHVSEWSERVTALHEELVDDLHGVWATQTAHLLETRLRAEQEYGVDSQEGPALII